MCVCLVRSYITIQVRLLWMLVFFLLNFQNSHQHGDSSNYMTPELPSRCICTGDILIYNCTLMGGPNDMTVWQGSAFDCPGTNEITLLNSRFTSQEGAYGECNNGDIVAKSLRVEGDLYTSQLSVNASPTTTGKNITCVHDSVGTSTLTNQFSTTVPDLTTDAGPLPPPNNLHISVANLGSKELTFIWSPVFPDCSSILYKIVSSDCGKCPTNTTKTKITCTDVPTNDNVCSIAVQTVLCGSVVGSLSDQVTVAIITTARKTQQQDFNMASVATIIAGGVMLLIAAALIFGCLFFKLIKRVINHSLHNRTRLTQSIGAQNDVNREEVGIVTLNESEGIYTYSELEETSLTLNSLLHNLQGQLPNSQWYQFGLAISVPKDVLNSLQHYSEKDHLVELLDYWLKHHPGQPTWREVADAKKKAEFYQLADNGANYSEYR